MNTINKILFMQKLFDDDDLYILLYEKNWVKDFSQILQELKEDYFHTLKAQNKIKYLGWANSWKERPKEYDEFINSFNKDITVKKKFGSHIEITANLTKKWWYQKVDENEY